LIGQEFSRSIFYENLFSYSSRYLFTPKYNDFSADGHLNWS